MRSQNAPGPKGAPITGSLWSFWKNVFTLFDKGQEKYGDIVRYRVVRDIYHLILHPDHITHVMVDNKSNYSRSLTHSSQVLHSVTGDSTLTLDGPQWAVRRRLGGPAFSPSSLNKYISSMLNCTDRLVKQWNTSLDESIEVRPAMSSLTAAIAGSTFFGADVPWDEEKLEQSMGAILDHHWQRIKSRTDLVHKLPSGSRRRFDKAMAYIRGIVANIVANENSVEETTLLSRLISARDEGQKLDLKGVQNEVITFLLAGHETTATALLWCIYELTQHPEWQDKIVAEAKEFLSDAESLDTSIVKRMNNTRKFFLEVLRMHPSVWLIERQALEDDIIGGFHIPAGSAVLMSSLSTHRHPDFWDRPNVFNPDRFTSDGNEIHKNAYFPFGLGPHTCIGKNFAILEGVIILGRLLQNYCIEANDPNFKPTYQVGITLRMKDALNIKISKR